MKIQCNVCGAEATVLCCADEAALCWCCDHRVHAKNKHHRVPLSSSSSSQMPKCDVCQETVGYIFCLEDRALLCRRCDISIHTANMLVSVHQRFLLTGVEVGLEATEAGPVSLVGKQISQLDERGFRSEPFPVSKRTTEASSTGQSSKSSSIPANMDADFSSESLPFTGGSAIGSVPQWQLDGFLELDNFSQEHEFMTHGRGSSKTCKGKMVDPQCSPILRAADVELEGDESMGWVPDSFWAVPEFPDPPTASGLSWPKVLPNTSDSGAFVPDIVSMSLQDNHLNADNSKRRRRFK